MSGAVDNTYLIKDKTDTGEGDAFQLVGDKRSFQASGKTTAGAGAAVIDVEVTNDPAKPWQKLASFSLVLGTSEVAEGFASDSVWKHVRGKVVSISGTGASVSLSMADRRRV